jgi:dienelactone hydrolase
MNTRETFMTFRESPENYWNLTNLRNAPFYKPAPAESQCTDMEAILFDGAEFNDKKAPVFALIGYPQGPVPEGGFPGIVLIHGGGGRAFPEYVKLWNSHGYAVIAIDWYNQRLICQNGIPQRSVPLEGGKRQKHIINVANMILANSLLRSLPKVNSDKIGFVGLSWGSWYGAMVASVDTRLRFAIQIYCGDIVPNRRKNKFINGRFIHAIKIPTYWIVSTNDQNVTPFSLQRSFSECSTVFTKSIVIKLPHSHVGFTFPACFRIADHFLKGAPPLPKLGKPSVKNGIVSAEILSEGKHIIKSILCYTSDRDQRIAHKRKWKSLPAKINGKLVSAELPLDTYQCYLSVYDEENSQNDCCGSSDILRINSRHKTMRKGS